MQTRFRLRKIMTTSVFRLILIVIIVIIPINVLTLILSSTTISEVQKQVSQDMENALVLYMSQLDDAMGRGSLKINYMARENVNFGRLNSKEVTDKDEYYKQLQAVVSLRNDMEEARRDSSWINGFYAYFPKKETFIIDSGYINSTDEIEDYIRVMVSDIPVEELNQWKITDVGGMQVLLMVSCYKNAYYGIWIDMNVLAKRLEIDSDEDGVIKMLTDDAGNVRITNEKEIEQVDLEDTHRTYSGADYVLLKAASSRSDLNMAYIISKNQVTHALPTMIRVLQIASILTLTVIPILMISMRKWMIYPLNKLSAAMEKIDAGDMEIRIKEEASGSEFEQINHNFNHMMDEVSALKINIYEEKLEKQQIKMRFLSQQIQPHFILNAMNILYSYEKEDFEAIQDMILCLSAYFRYIVNANADFVELSQEMGHIKNYFAIQQTRYPDTFFTMVEYEEELSDCLIPPLLIQNFAENAIKHSLQIENTIDIFVIAQKFGDNQVRIRLSDTGEGICEELIEKVEIFQKTRQYQEGLGVGIQNAVERLDILYKGAGTLNIKKEIPHGTRVEIVIPLIRENEIERRKLEDI